MLWVVLVLISTLGTGSGGHLRRHLWSHMGCTTRRLLAGESIVPIDGSLILLARWHLHVLHASTASNEIILFELTAHLEVVDTLIELFDMITYF